MNDLAGQRADLPFKDHQAEHELLVCIARKSLPQSESERLRSLAQEELDWSYLLESATTHGLLPLLANHVTQQAANLVPQTILDQLRRGLLNSRKDNLYLLNRLFGVLRLFKTEKLRTLAFKGPVLGGMLYDDVGLRQAGDLDLLIARQDFLRARELLQSAGFLMEPQLTSAQMASQLRTHCEMPFVGEDKFSVVDLHWGLTPKSFPFPVNFEDLFARRQKISLGGQEVETFADEDLLLYLCVHGAKHYWSRLEWVAAVAELVRSKRTLDWPALLQLAKDCRVQRILALGVQLTKDLFSVEMDPEVDACLNLDGSMARCVEAVKARLFLNGIKPLGQIEMLRLNLQFMNRRRDAVAALLRSALVPTIADWQAANLSGSLYPLYYGFRPMRLLVKHVASSKDEG